MNLDLDLKGLLKQLFSATLPEKHQLIGQFEADVRQARVQLEEAERALSTVRSLVGLDAAPTPTREPTGSKAAGEQTARRPRTNGSSSEADIARVFEVIQSGVSKTGEIETKTGIERNALKKLLATMTDRGLIEMSGSRGGARYSIKPGASAPAAQPTSPQADPPTLQNAREAPASEPEEQEATPEAPAAQEVASAPAEGSNAPAPTDTSTSAETSSSGPENAPPPDISTSPTEAPANAVPSDSLTSSPEASANGTTSTSAPVNDTGTNSATSTSNGNGSPSNTNRPAWQPHNAGKDRQGRHHGRR